VPAKARPAKVAAQNAHLESFDIVVPPLVLTR
jgi:hypothetical protein